MADSDLNGKIIGGGGIKTTVADGEVYMSITDIVNHFTNVALQMTSLAVISQDPFIKGQARTMIDLGLEFDKLRNHHTAPGLFEDTK